MKKILYASASLAFVLLSPAANASVLAFQNDFSAGLSAQESVTGSFYAAAGYVGHHATYNNFETSSYVINIDRYMTGAVLSFDLTYAGEYNYDYLTVMRNGSALASWTYYSGSPVFSLGNLNIGSNITFRFTSDGSVVNSGVKIDNVRIVADTVSAVPEPATWALMLGGFAMVGTAMRYRRRGVAVVAA